MPVATDLPVLLPAMSLPDLESELLGLAGHIAAAECRFLQLLAEFDRRGGWAGIGVRSCSHWLAWRAGMSRRTATEHLRVAHALSDLPRITAAFAAGRISYSKVRAITRVTAPGAAVLTRIAAASGAPSTPAGVPNSHATRTGNPHTGPLHTDTTRHGDAADAPAADAPVAGSPTAGSATADTPAAGPADDAGTVPGTATDDPATRDPAATPYDPATPSTPATPGSPATPNAPAAAGPPVVDPGTADQVLLDLALSGTASHVETVVREARRRTVPPADLTERRGLTWYHDADGSLVVRARFTPEDGAALIAAIESRVPAPVPGARRGVAPPPDVDRQALERAPGRAVDRRAAHRADALLELVQGSDDATAPVVARGTAEIVVHVEVADGTARIAGGPEIATATAERLACDARARVLLDDRATNRLYLGRSRRLASPAQIAALTIRDGGCRFPGCDRRRRLHAHHVRPWLHGGHTDIDNLVLLCGHHHRLVHEHRYRIRPGAGGGWDVRRPDGLPVEPAGAPLTGDAEALAENNARAGLAIDRDTLTPAWYGDRLDPEPILDALLPPETSGAATAA